jgi:sugar lactone lactonase YvrE
MQQIPAEPMVLRPSSVLGEAPLWDAMRAELSWVDCDRRRLFRLHPAANTVRMTDLAAPPGSYAFRKDGRLLMAYRTGLAVLDPESGCSDPIETPMVDFSAARFNDGSCDRAGRFWLGTMHKSMSEPVGALYRVDPDLSIRRMAEGIVVSNGIAFSPDDKVMYHTDSKLAVIYACDFDICAGEIANRRVFADFSGRHERPDGCTVDRNGRVWVAMLGGGRVATLDPDGREMASLRVPASRPTSLCFGGSDLGTLYVTSMTLSLSPDELAAQPDAGCVFAFDGVGQGLPEPLFG